MSVYDTVTNRILEELERGTVPWVKTTLPYNAVSEKAYSAVNIFAALVSTPCTTRLAYVQASQGIRRVSEERGEGHPCPLRLDLKRHGMFPATKPKKRSRF